jgi:hypothetical protein
LKSQPNAFFQVGFRIPPEESMSLLYIKAAPGNIPGPGGLLQECP